MYVTSQLLRNQNIGWKLDMIFWLRNTCDVTFPIKILFLETM